MATPFDAPAVRVIPFRVIKDFNYTECRSAIYLEEVLAPFRVLRDRELSPDKSGSYTDGLSFLRLHENAKLMLFLTKIGVTQGERLLTEMVTTPFVLSALRSKVYRSMSGVATVVFRITDDLVRSRIRSGWHGYE